MASDASEDHEDVEQRQVGEPEPVEDAGLRAELPASDERQTEVLGDAAEPGLDPGGTSGEENSGDVVVEWTEGSFRHEGADRGDTSDGDTSPTRLDSGTEGPDQATPTRADDPPKQGGHDGVELAATERDHEKDLGSAKVDASVERPSDAGEAEPGMLSSEDRSVPEAVVIGLQDGVEIHQGARELIGGTWI